MYVFTLPFHEQGSVSNRKIRIKRAVNGYWKSLNRKVCKGQVQDSGKFNYRWPGTLNYELQEGEWKEVQEGKVEL